MYPGVYALQNRTEHRVDRVLSFFSGRPNLDSPTPLPAGECVPPPWFGGGGAHSLAGEGAGESQLGRGDKHCGTLVMYVLCGIEPRAKSRWPTQRVL
jgi:hypothetical protein